MKNKDHRTDDAGELRRRAEKKAKSDETKIRKTLSAEEARQMLHELRVHQIELEMQNEELRRAQESLEALRARYFDLYDLAPMGYFVLSEQGLILEANLTAATLLGEVRGALVKQPMTRFILEEDQDIYYRHHKQLFRTGDPQACELRLVKKGGEAFWAHLEATTARDAEGAPVCRVSLNDITERKRAEEALRESEARYRLLIENALFSAVVVSIEEARVLFINERASAMFGVPASNAKGLFAPDFWGRKEDLHRYIQLVNEQGVVKDFETELRSKSGVRMTVLLSSNLIDFAGRKAIFTVFQDISERKRAEEALKQSEEKFRALFEHMEAASCLDEIIYEDGKAVDYRILDINPSFERITGIGRTKAVGMPASQVYGLAAVPFLDIYAKVAETGEPASFETFFPPIGKHLHITASCPAKGRFSAVFTDISDGKRAESELKAQIAELQRWHNITLGRENRILDLKREVNELLGQAGKPPRYPSAESQDNKKE
jgi:PAS domain S-box-containing protein